MKEKCPDVANSTGPTPIMMTLILSRCLFNFGHNNFRAAHNDLIAIVVTQSNLMVDDSDELFSQIFTAFPSFGVSRSRTDSSQFGGGQWYERSLKTKGANSRCHVWRACSGARLHKLKEDLYSVPV